MNRTNEALLTERHIRLPAGVQRRCEQCGSMFLVTGLRLNRYRSYLRGAKVGKRPTRFCTPRCYQFWGVAHPVLAMNPRGSDYCRAPVPGGCDRKRSDCYAGHSRAAYCDGHDKRRQRGQAMDTPLLFACTWAKPRLAARGRKGTPK